MRENIVELTNHILSTFWSLVLIGAIHIIISELRIIISVIKKGRIALVELKPFGHKILYMLLGIVLILTSFALVNYLVNTFFVLDIWKTANFESMNTDSFWSMMKYQSQFAGLFATLGIIAAGICLVLSAGGRWLVNLSKLFITSSIIYLVVSFYSMYA